MTFGSVFTAEDFFPEDGYNFHEHLPALIQHACGQFSDPVERDVFFYSALGVLSGCLPNYLGHYDGNWVSPHLYLFILAPYGTGKGSMRFSRCLGEAIHDAKIARTRELMRDYREQSNQNQSEQRSEESATANSATPSKPKNEKLFLPADSSKSALIDSLFDNGGCGVIFETEGDTLTSAMKQEFGMFRDVLLKGYHHEAISFQRRKDDEFKEIKTPRIAVVLSSTYDQFRELVKSAESGLVSRFMYYLLPPSNEFRDVFSSEKQFHLEYFQNLGQSVKTKYEYLYSRTEPIYFQLTHDQKTSFNHYFKTAKQDADGLEGNVNRLGLMCYRIAMLLSFFRHYDYKYDDAPPTSTIWCDDRDFTNALAIVKVLHENMETVHTLLPASKQGSTPGNKQTLYNALPTEFTAKEAKEKGKDCGIGKRTVERYLTDETMYLRLEHGQYRKVQLEN